MGFPLTLLLVISLVVPAPVRHTAPLPVPDSPKGFDKQYKSVFKAYEKRNGPQVMERLRTFAIPEHWFTDMFGPEDGPRFARAYWQEFHGFEAYLIGEFNIMAATPSTHGDSSQIKTNAFRTKADLLSVSAPISLLPLPPVQRFRVHYFTAPNFVDEGNCLTIISVGYSKHSIQPFIYIDGAFRFAGDVLNQIKTAQTNINQPAASKTVVSEGGTNLIAGAEQ